MAELIIVMIAAFVYHILNAEYALLGVNIFLGAIAGFIVWGRYKQIPIQEK